MAGYIARRLLLMVPVVLLVTTVLFVLMRLTPGDPVQIEFGIEATPELRQALGEELGLDRPLPVQYWDWLSRMAHGDFGSSIRARRPALDEISERMPATLELTALSFLLTVVIALPLGTLAAVRRRGLLARLTTLFTVAAVALPGYFVSTMLVYFFTYRWRVLETPRFVPFSEDPLANLESIALPVIALSVGGIAVLTRHVRAAVEETLGQEYLRTARAKGLHERTILVRHALRNAAIPVITVAGGMLAMLWTGAVVTERVFNWPGIGRLLTGALLAKDYPVVQACLVLVTLGYCLVNLLVDILYAVVDPRISYVRAQ